MYRGSLGCVDAPGLISGTGLLRYTIAVLTLVIKGVATATTPAAPTMLAVVAASTPPPPQTLLLLPLLPVHLLPLPPTVAAVYAAAAGVVVAVHPVMRDALKLLSYFSQMFGTFPPLSWSGTACISTISDSSTKSSPLFPEALSRRSPKQTCWRRRRRMMMTRHCKL